MLDADEQLAEGAGEIIRSAIEAGGLDCGYLPLVRVESPSETFDPAAMDEDSFSRMPRLLRRTIDLRWDSGGRRECQRVDRHACASGARCRCPDRQGCEHGL